MFLPVGTALRPLAGGIEFGTLAKRTIAGSTILARPFIPITSLSLLPGFFIAAIGTIAKRPPLIAKFLVLKSVTRRTVVPIEVRSLSAWCVTSLLAAPIL